MSGERCGTDVGYQDHRAATETPCRDCCDARALYMLQLRRRKMLGLPTRAAWPDELVPPRWADSLGDMAQVGAVFRAGVVMSA